MIHCYRYVRGGTTGFYAVVSSVTWDLEVLIQLWPVSIYFLLLPSRLVVLSCIRKRDYARVLSSLILIGEDGDRQMFLGSNFF